MTFLTDEQIERLKKIQLVLSTIHFILSIFRSESVSEQMKKRENERILAEERKKVFNEVYGQG